MRISHGEWSPEPCGQVRILLGAHNSNMLSRNATTAPKAVRLPRSYFRLQASRSGKPAAARQGAVAGSPDLEGNGDRHPPRRQGLAGRPAILLRPRRMPVTGNGKLQRAPAARGIHQRRPPFTVTTSFSLCRSHPPRAEVDLQSRPGRNVRFCRLTVRSARGARVVDQAEWCADKLIAGVTPHSSTPDQH
jgi:hypothetical protein